MTSLSINCAHICPTVTFKALKMLDLVSYAKFWLNVTVIGNLLTIISMGY